MSGLTLALFSLDPLKLKVLMKDGDPLDKKRAQKLIPLLKNHHQLLCTLLIVNSAANVLLPLFLDVIVPSWAAVLLSVTAVLVFGEILPQAVLAKESLALGAKFAPIVKVLVLLVTPVAWPLGKILDYFLGADQGPELFDPKDLKTLVELHAEDEGGGLHSDEVMIMKHTMELRRKTAGSIMTPLKEVFMLPHTAVLDFQTIDDIIVAGFSRVPIFKDNPAHIVGILHVKRLLRINPENKIPVSRVQSKVYHVSTQMKLFDLLNEFQKGDSHLAMVAADAKELRHRSASFTGSQRSKSPLRRLQPRQALYQRNVVSPDAHNMMASDNCVIQGVVSLEDVIEEMIGEEIEDEFSGGMASTATTLRYAVKWKNLAKKRRKQREAEEVKRARPNYSNSKVTPSPASTKLEHSDAKHCNTQAASAPPSSTPNVEAEKVSNEDSKDCVVVVADDTDADAAAHTVDVTADQAATKMSPVVTNPDVLALNPSQ